MTNMAREVNKPIYLTTGEPAGIGPDITLLLAAHTPPTAVWVALASMQLLAERAAMLGLTLQLIPWQQQATPAAQGSLYVLDIALAAPVQAGVLNPANSPYVIAQLHTASTAALNGTCQAIVTAPVHKAVINQAGIAFSGHTEYFAQQAGVAKVVMMLATPTLKVALATTHLPLKAVPAAITAELLTQVIGILHHDLQHKFAIAAPRIAVCGLNPHAGENGYLGDEEINMINPTLNVLRAQGINVSEALAADTLFTTEHLAPYDAVLAMYHDQGLPVLKSQGFGEAVNITLGLPYVRTSVDHGTALALAGTGQAQYSSLQAALQMAVALSNNF